MVGDNEQYGNPEGVSFFALIREDYVTNGRDWSAPGFRALLIHRFGNWRMGIRSRALRAPMSLLYQSLFGMYATTTASNSRSRYAWGGGSRSTTSRGS